MKKRRGVTARQKDLRIRIFGGDLLKCKNFITYGNYIQGCSVTLSKF